MSSYSTNLFSGAVAISTAGAAFLTLSDQEKTTNYQAFVISLGLLAVYPIGITPYHLLRCPHRYLLTSPH